MDEAGVSSTSKVDGLQVNRAAADTPQISVNTYPTSPEKAVSENDSHDHSHENKNKRTARYPFASVFFLLGNTIGQSYSGTGLQAVLELYFAPFLYVCSGTARANKLSTTSVNVYIAVYQLCALSAGFLADKVFGNFIVQTVSVVVSTSGLFLLTFSTWQLTLDQPHCCSEANYSSLTVSYQSGLSTGHQSMANCSELNKVTFLEHFNLGISPSLNIALAIVGLMLYAVGYGHINTLQSVLVADQFAEEQSQSKERSFSWFYLCCNVGSLVGESGMPIIRQTVGFVVAWMTVFGSSVVSLLLFLTGSCFYVKKKPQRPSCRCTISKTHIHTEPSVNVLSDNQERKPLLDGQISTQHSSKNSQLSLSSTTIETTSKSTLLSRLTRLKELLPFLGVFAPLVVFWAIFYQQNSTWILQGAQMNCHLGRLQVPPDLMPSINDFMVILIIPTLDYLVYPHLEKTMGYKVQPLHKLVGGMVAAALSFLMSGLLQLYLHEPNVPYCHGDISIMWQLPQLLLISFAEVLVSVTGLEFAYSQAPPDFRNIITSFWYIAQALGTLLNAGIAQIPGLTLLKEFFTYMALMLVVTLVFVLINWRYQYRYTEKQRSEVAAAS